MAHIDEPLIVEAGNQWYGLEDLVERYCQYQDKGSHVDDYEKLCICPMQSKLTEKLAEAFSHSQFGDYSIFTKSAYGVIALRVGVIRLVVHHSW